ncbi:hypothetical protein [Mycobacterium sp. 050134]|uniref:hypothetical protein n=1 Tax=Mycobacterium sp. 050134 TaxID=3096111 RepID=UPI002ED90CBD
MQDLDPAQADDEPDVPRGVWAARRADELARRIAELQDDAKPPTENDVALARQREKEAHYRARRAHLADAERHEEAARIHEETAAMHEQAVIDQIGDEEAHLDAAATHRTECEKHKRAAVQARAVC